MCHIPGLLEQEGEGQEGSIAPPPPLQILEDTLTYYQSGRKKIMQYAHHILQAHLDFQTFLRPCILETNGFLFNIDNTFIDPVSRSETCKLYR